MTSTTAQPAVSSTELPIYQRLLDESDPGTRDTVIAQQGEGHAPKNGAAVADDDGLGRHI